MKYAYFSDYWNTKVISIHCNVVKISYKQSSRVLHTVIQNKPYCQLL